MNIRKTGSSLSLSGSILLSHPTLRDPNFLRTIVFVSTHSSETGTLGVIINRPMTNTLAELDSSFQDNPLADTQVYEGGPVEKEKLIIAAWEWMDSPNSFKLHFGIDVNRAMSIKESNPDADFVCFAGHSGWSPGQLESELEENAWVVSTLDKNTFDKREENSLWKNILGNISGELRFLADAPEDPTSN
ncbi:MAG: YqgE/AlgH family protein [Opitutales bacterium]